MTVALTPGSPAPPPRGRDGRWPQAARRVKCTGSLALVQSGARLAHFQIWDMQPPSPLGGTQAASMPSGCLGVEKGQMQLGVSKRPPARLPTCCLSHSSRETRNNTTLTNWARGEEGGAPRARGQMSEPPFPPVPLLMLVGKRKEGKPLPSP